MINFKNLENRSFIIAEVGQNHQGDINIAKKYVEVFASMGADAIKFQTRNNKLYFQKKPITKNITAIMLAKKYGEYIVSRA